MGEICSFSKLNISVIVDDGASFLITDMYKLLYCLSKKCLFNDLELEYQGQMAHVSSIALFSQEMATRLHLKTFKTSKKQSFILNILQFSDFFLFFILEGMGSNFTKACYLNVTPVHS